MMRRRVAIGTVLAGGLLAGSGAQAAEEGVMVKNLLGAVGIISEDRPAIDYRERAPLVLPPRMELREPAAPGAAETRAAQWPNDPDVLAEKRKQADARVPVTESELRRANDRERLSIQEMQAGRRQTSSASQPRPARGEKNDGSWVRPEELTNQRTGGDDTAVLAGGEPTRGRLAQPPTGFRKPAAGAPVKADSEPVVREDESSAHSFHRQQARR